MPTRVSRVRRMKSNRDLSRQAERIYATARQQDPNITYAFLEGRYTSSSPNQQTVNRLNQAFDTFNRYRRNIENSPRWRKLDERSRQAFNSGTEEEWNRATERKVAAKFGRGTYMGLSVG